MNSKNIEYEAKVLNISEQEIRDKLTKLGATKVADYEFKRFVFDTIPSTPNRWVRLRSNGRQTTLTVKEINNNEIDGTSEWEVEVSDINECLTILQKIGIKPRGYQENLRTEFSLKGVEVSIDKWPKLHPYIEIEGSNKEEVITTAKLLGFSESDLTSVNTEALYSELSINLKEVKELKF
jgi:adenylate cyclase class 2